MQWNAAYVDMLINSSLVCLGAASLSLIIGLSVALLTSCFCVPGHRIISALMLSLLFVPIYVQATAWSAGFGVHGWLRVSQVAAALSPMRAILSVVWIHGVAAAPLCFLFCALGIRRAMNETTRQALIDFGPWYCTIQIILPRLMPWAALGLIWTTAVTGNDMVVTNLFQVPTFTESAYQQVQFNELRWGAMALTCVLPISLSVTMTLLYLRFGGKLGEENTGRSAPASFAALIWKGPSRWLGTCWALALVVTTVLLPIANLIARAGWVSEMVDGSPRRRWALGTLWTSVTQTPSLFATEFQWSLQLSALSTCVALVLAAVLVGVVRRHWAHALLIATMTALLAIPGPLVNLLVISLFDRSEPEWLGWLNDRTLIGPVLALQFRLVPIAYGILWIGNERFRRSHGHVVRIDAGLSQITQLWIRVRALGQPILLMAIVSFFVAFADLSSYLLVQPPGVTTIAMRMFELLHYGVKNQESGLGVMLVLGSFLPAGIAIRWGLNCRDLL